MKTYVPDRTALIVKPIAPKRPAKRTPRFTFSFATVAYGIGGIVTLILVIAFDRETRRQRDTALTAVATTRAALNSHLQELQVTKKSEQALSSEAKQLRDQLSFGKGNLEKLELDGRALQSRLKQIEADAERERTTVRSLTTDRNAIQQRLDESKAKVESLAKLSLERTMELAEAFRSDPAQLETVLHEWKAFAESNSLDVTALDRRLLSIPTQKAIPLESLVTVHSTRLEGGTLLIDFSLKSASGDFIDGLGRREIELVDGSRRVHALEVTETKQRIGRQHLAMLLDFSGSMEGAPREAMLDGVSRFLHSVGDSARFKPWAFADDVVAVTPWSVDVELHEEAIRGIAAKGATSLYKGLRLAAEDLRTQPGARAIVLFTDGGDSFQKESLDAVIELCRQSEIAVHVVSLRTSETKSDILQRIATETRGTLHEAEEASQVALHFSRIAKSLQRRVYRLRISEPLDAEMLTLTVGDLPPMQIHRTSAIRSPK